MKKKMLSILLASALTVGMLAGCGGKTDDSNAGNAGGNNGGGETSDGTIKLPLTEEKVTLKVWMPKDGNFFSIMSDYNESEFFKEMERRTNVHLEFDVPSDAATAYNLMISSGELPDLICMPVQYPDGMDAAIDDGYYLDVSQYFDTYLYNYNQVRQKDPKFLRDTVTDSGRSAYIAILNTEPQGPWIGLQIRQDWLDELKLDTPVTYDDLENVLTQFKEKKGCKAPLAFSSSFTYVFGEMSAGYGVKNDFINRDGKVVAGFATDEWRQFLIRMHDWYVKGLIDQDFMTHSPFMAETELVTTGASGVWYGMYTWPSFMYEPAVPGMVVMALAAPKLNKDDTVHIRLQDTYVAAGGVAISADSKYKEIAMQWVDYLYTKEGADLANYGIEGKSFVYGADGKPELTDEIKNAEGGAMKELLKYALIPSQIPSHYAWTREIGSVPEKDLKSYDIWASADHLDDWVMPPISMTADESKERQSHYADISTHVTECTGKFITGELDINGADWDKYIETIKGMGLDRCVEITQGALDRYLSR